LEISPTPPLASFILAFWWLVPASLSLDSLNTIFQIDAQSSPPDLNGAAASKKLFLD
jgi:hypothetical protein